MLIKCEEANKICDKSQYQEASFWERIKLELHLLTCKACRKYTKGNMELTKLINYHLDNLSEHPCQRKEQMIFGPDKKKSIQKQINAEVKKTAN